MRLCSHRPETFGPHSSLHPTLPTTCFEDVVLVPLATWIFIALVLVVLVPSTIRTLRRVRTSTNAGPQVDNKCIGHLRGPGSFFSSAVNRSRKPVRKVAEKDGGTSGSFATSTSKSRWGLGLACAILYYFLIIAMVAMVSLEIARQISAKVGIGLLPFNYVGVLGAFLAHAFVHTKTSRLVSFSFWIFFFVFMIVKVATYAKESDEGYKRIQVVDGVPLDMYKVSDQITDDATMVGVSFVLAMLEALGIFGLTET